MEIRIGGSSSRAQSAHVQSSYITPRVFTHISRFGLVFFVLKSLLGITRQRSRKKLAILILGLGVMLEFFLFIECGLSFNN